MKTSANKLYAIATGDVVGSSKMTPSERERLPDVLRQTAHEVRKAFPEAVPLDVDIFRGDGWQLLSTAPALSLRIGLFFRASVIASAPKGSRRDTRLSIAVGQVNFVPGSRVSEGDGEAYRLSGQGLDALKEPQRMSFVQAGSHPDNQNAVVRLIDVLVRGWTAAQARAVLGRLRNMTQVQIARSWPGAIAQQAVATHLERAHWPEVEAGIISLENSLKVLSGGKTGA